MKKLASLLIVSLLLLCGQAAYAQNEVSEAAFDSVAKKKALALEHADKWVNLSEAEVTKRTLEVEQILNELAADVAYGKITEEEAKHNLEKNNIYMLDVPNLEKENENIGLLSVGSTDITMNKVWITQDAVTRNWNLTGGGYWKNTAWFDDMGWQVWSNNQIRNLGGVDSVGITLYNTSGSYTGVQVVSSSGYVTDHNGWTETLNNPSHGNGKYGVAFDFQDKVKYTGGCANFNCSSDYFTYLGKGFAASITYNSTFVNYNGSARSMYAHTWDNTTINSIGLTGGAGNWGINMSWSHSANRWMIVNDSDTSF
ncbi:hypothetical protein [Paenibacillus sp. TSA_86.1]|uniref:hypothetical protein n=1 Tax=Paenibacillus sp. TSA_86.1 TaxID=3415649 RepID=UPI004045486C